MEASQHILLAACFTLHSINATLAIVPQLGAGPWIYSDLTFEMHGLSSAVYMSRKKKYNELSSGERLGQKLIFFARTLIRNLDILITLPKYGGAPFS
jgi:hypothetical protein